MDLPPSNVIQGLLGDEDKGGAPPDRKFVFEEHAGGRRLVSESVVPTDADRALVQRFVQRTRSGDCIGAALAVVPLHGEAAARFRAAFREMDADLVGFVRTSFAQAAALGNWVAALLANTAEFLADECHMATMGLSDNHGAIVDVVCGAPELLAQVNLFYGVRFGDGRYVVKSADGQGDRDKLRKDVCADASSARLRDFLGAVLRTATSSPPAAPVPFSDEMLSSGGAGAAQLEAFLAGGSAGARAELEQRAGGAAPLAALCDAAAAGDAKLARALRARAVDRHTYWLGRLGDAVHGPALNKKLLLRIACANAPAERAALVQAYSAAHAGQPLPLAGLAGPELQLVRAVFASQPQPQ